MSFTITVLQYIFFCVLDFSQDNSKIGINFANAFCTTCKQIPKTNSFYNALNIK